VGRVFCRKSKTELGSSHKYLMKDLLISDLTTWNKNFEVGLGKRIG
jgi:hypothetical protein